VVTIVDQTEQTDEQLAAEAAREGSNGPAFAALLQRHRERVWRICYRLMGNDHDANDAVQEVFVSFFLQRASFAGKAKFSTWLHSVAVRTCLMLRRGRGRRQKRETTATDGQIQQHAVADDSSAVGLSLDLTRMLETLDEEDRALIILKYAEDYSYEELSGIFRRSPSALKMRVSRAREKLREQFGNETH
jgi:RNA polymerase sigma-70 factor (ECF subfamily)